MNRFKKIKQKSKKILFKHYLLIIFTCLISAFIGVEFTGSIAFVSRSNVGINIGNKGVLASVINMFTSKTLFNYLTQSISSIIGSEKIANILLTVLGFILTIIFWAFIKNVYRVISRRIILESRVYEKVPASRFKFLLKIKKWFKASLTMLVCSIKYFLWMFTIVGAFIKKYEYFCVPYIVAENPDISHKQALNLSKRMMYNHKMECFLLDLSFIGYKLLGLVSLGISEIIFSNGYELITYSEYYANIRSLYISNKGKDYQYLFDKYLFEKAPHKLLEETYKDVYEPSCDKTLGKPKGFRGFLYNYLGINLYDEAASKKYEDRLISIYNDKYYSDTISGKSYPTRLYPLPEKKKRKHIEVADYIKSYNITSLILMFFTFSTIGWLWEVLLHLVSDGKFVNRGVFYGPWLPIYGSGALLILILLKKFRTKPSLEFFLIIILCGTVEYFTALYLETTFNSSWWDYTGYFLNIKGRVCAEGLLVFGLGGMAVVYLLAPLLDNFYKRINKTMVYSLCIILLSIFTFDKIYSGLHPNTGEGVSSDNINQKIR